MFLHIPDGHLVFFNRKQQRNLSHFVANQSKREVRKEG